MTNIPRSGLKMLVKTETRRSGGIKPKDAGVYNMKLVRFTLRILGLVEARAKV